MDIYKIKRLVYLSPIGKSRLINLYRFNSRKVFIHSVIKRFGREKDTEKLMPLIKEAYVKYRWNIEEFFLFGYEQLTDEQRKEFCPEYDHNAFCLKVNNWATARIFRDKRATYLKFKDFFNRSCVYVSNSSEYNSDECQEFIKNNPVFLLKPIGTCCGRGIQKLTNNAPNLQDTILSVAVMGG